jgi:hypothetical protein
VRVDRSTQELKSAFYGGSWGFLRDYGYPRNLTTNQKVTGSSPAERAVFTITLTITRRGFTRIYERLSVREEKKSPLKGAFGELPDLDSNQD